MANGKKDEILKKSSTATASLQTSYGLEHPQVLKIQNCFTKLIYNLKRDTKQTPLTYYPEIFYISQPNVWLLP
jgi:hypothetical protein